MKEGRAGCVAAAVVLTVGKPVVEGVEWEVLLRLDEPDNEAED